jgi:hypothetical protein
MSLLFSLITLASVAVSQAEQRPQSARTHAAEERAVLSTIDAFFGAVNRKDRTAINSNILSEGLATSIRLDGGPRMRSWHWPTYIEQVVFSAPEPFEERLFAPEIRIERDIAMVWARYELVAGGTFSHCGFNHFDMVRKGGRWLIYNLTWTNQTKGCPGR